MDTPGRVFWITGLSAAGKTSIGRALSSHLRASGCSVIFLDGDTLRAVSNDLGYSAENRREAAMRNGMLCRMLAEQGFDVVCSTISLFHDVQRWNRENITRYNEIFVRVPLEELNRKTEEYDEFCIGIGGLRLCAAVLDGRLQRSENDAGSLLNHFQALGQ